MFVKKKTTLPVDSDLFGEQLGPEGQAVKLYSTRAVQYALHILGACIETLYSVNLHLQIALQVWSVAQSPEILKVVFGS